MTEREDEEVQARRAPRYEKKSKDLARGWSEERGRLREPSDYEGHHHREHSSSLGTRGRRHEDYNAADPYQPHGSSRSSREDPHGDRKHSRIEDGRDGFLHEEKDHLKISRHHVLKYDDARNRTSDRDKSITADHNHGSSRSSLHDRSGRRPSHRVDQQHSRMNEPYDERSSQHRNEQQASQTMTRRHDSDTEGHPHRRYSSADEDRHAKRRSTNSHHLRAEDEQHRLGDKKGHKEDWRSISRQRDSRPIDHTPEVGRKLPALDDIKRRLSASHSRHDDPSHTGSRGRTSSRESSSSSSSSRDSTRDGSSTRRPDKHIHRRSRSRSRSRSRERSRSKHSSRKHGDGDKRKRKHKERSDSRDRKRHRVQEKARKKEEDRRSVLTGKKIKLKVKKDKGDHQRDANREDLLQFLNSTFG
ncbi:hypothetical protein B0H34DRAFT_736478 [Crassisporium funariophilum]|nr:hypothetical protein B0H34DRAFT_736478 [Crassisporium funariophilum]